MDCLVNGAAFVASFPQQLIPCSFARSFLEIYNETITDLLNPSATNLQIREDTHGRGKSKHHGESWYAPNLKGTNLQAHPSEHCTMLYCTAEGKASIMVSLGMLPTLRGPGCLPCAPSACEHASQGPNFSAPFSVQQLNLQCSCSPGLLCGVPDRDRGPQW
eukprot:1161078-Pelagomonas_calceolata.AAC.18